MMKAAFHSGGMTSHNIHPSPPSVCLSIPLFFLLSGPGCGRGRCGLSHRSPGARGRVNRTGRVHCRHAETDKFVLPQTFASFPFLFTTICLEVRGNRTTQENPMQSCKTCKTCKLYTDSTLLLLSKVLPCYHV